MTNGAENDDSDCCGDMETGSSICRSEKLLMVRPADLKPWPRNARTHSKKQVQQLARSIERFGFTNPVLIDESGMILAGHGRVEAAKLMSMEEIPCLRLADMSDAEKRAYVLADNKLAQNAGWDEELLALELQTLLEFPDIIDIELTGFTIAEIDELIDIGGTDPELETDRDDQLPHVKDGARAVTQAGDLWILGDHKLICGDARDADVYRHLLRPDRGDAELAQMVFTDPPYNVPVNGHVMGSGKVKHREFAMAAGEMCPDTFAAFLKSVFVQLVTHSCDGSIHYVCMDWRHMNEVLAAGGVTYSELKNLIFWVKDNGGMGSFYRSRHELVFAFKNGTAPHINTFELGQHGRYRTNVWNYRGISSATKAAREELALHPTVKPVAMVADAMLDCSARGGIVLDAFCGSGTILIAAQKMGRRARAIELDPLYCDTAVRRWQIFAKGDAVLADTGETFEQVAARRRLESNTAEVADPTSEQLQAGCNEKHRSTHECDVEERLPFDGASQSSSDAPSSGNRSHALAEKTSVRSPWAHGAETTNAEGE